MRPRPIAFAYRIAGFAALLCPAPAAAQALEGRVTEAATQQPVPRATVLMLDSAGSIVGRAVADSAGAFRLRAPEPGEFRLHADRLGYRPTLTRMVAIEAEQTLAVEVRMAPEPIALDTAVSAAPRRRGIAGRVVDDETGLPVAGATVTLISSRELRAGRAVTDSAGRFHLRVPQPDAFQLRAERVGYRRASSDAITVMPDDTVQVELRLSTGAVLLAPLTVVAASRQVVRDHQLAGFEWRRGRQPFGRFMGPDEIRRINPFYASDVLQQMPMVQVRSSGASQFDRMVTLPARGRGMGPAPRCVPSLYLDGRPVRLFQGMTIDDLVSGSSVAAVEVYTSPGGAPGEFPPHHNPFCGVIVIWTKVGR
ncbi:MAG: carboxypeptidase regulatory-like domain-containing protein [Gemmatimonadetes bacterium]|nr:carboxypeptidase regulatory-like domain-containing protein [Gemmatimonadota bacterium]